MNLRINKSVTALVIALFACGVHGELVSTGMVKSVDNIPPMPVTKLAALNAGTSIQVTWNLSIDDAVTFSSFGEAIVPRGGVLGYKIYRTMMDDDESLLIGTVDPGIGQFIDTNVAEGFTYIYDVIPFDHDNETPVQFESGSTEDLLRIVKLGGIPDAETVKTIKGSITIDSNLDLNKQDSVDVFLENLLKILADIMAIDQSRIEITDIRSGSVIVEFEIAEIEDDSKELPAAEALSNFITATKDETADEFAFLGGTLASSDETTIEVVRITKPLDENGNKIVGWFTREGTRVDLDDFFLFVDHFGETPENDEWDARFDIVPNEVVDLEDFFLFSDDFGKTVVNAEKIKEQMGR